MPARPLPTPLRILHGTPGSKTVGEVPTTEALSARSKPPSTLGADGRRLWRELLGATDGRPGWLLRTDRPALEQLCSAWDTWAEATRAVRLHGVLVPGRSSADGARGDDGALVKNPAVQVARDAQAAVRAWARELGLTPDSRGRLTLPAAATDVDDEELFGPAS